MRGRILLSVGYLVLVAVTFAVFRPPRNAAAFHILLAVYGALHTGRVWRRTGLALATIGGLLACAFLIVPAILIIRGVGFWSHLPAYLIPMGLLLAGALVCRLVEQRRHPDEMAAIKAGTKGRPWWDVSLPPVPNLRESGRGRTPLQPAGDS